MDRITQCLSMAMALAISTPLLAVSEEKPTEEPSWYQVDVIVFLNKASMNTMTEAWPEPRLRPIPKDAAPLTRWDAAAVPANGTPAAMPSDLADKNTTAFIALPSSDFLLTDEASRLNRSSDYQVLRQMAWRMPLSPDQKDHPIRISTPVDEQSNYMLSGTIDVSAQRYLHVDVDLWYNQLAATPEMANTAVDALALSTGNQLTPSSPSNPASGPAMRVTKSFQLDESRRVTNTQQVQYLDTPVISVLFKLTPYELPGIEKKKSPDQKTQDINTASVL